VKHAYNKKYRSEQEIPAEFRNTVLLQTGTQSYSIGSKQKASAQKAYPADFLEDKRQKERKKKSQENE
jgi:hypothetical protein